jgi:hypothetical protein
MRTAILLTAIFCLATGFAYAQDVRYNADIKPIFDAKCAGSCHADGALEYEAWKKDSAKLKENMVGMKMDTFRSITDFVLWPNTGALMRRIDNGQNTKDGKPGNMFEYLGDTPEEREKNLAVFKKWVPVWSLGRLNDLTKEQIVEQNKIRDRY